MPQTFLSKNTIGGNAAENWTLLRFLPFMIGDVIPDGEPVWEIILDLKEIVDLAVAQIHTEESIGYLQFKISDHRQKYQEAFPNRKLLPKHHYLEHYPHMIRCFGPLVGVWTMRFEGKHSFLKEVARHTKCFKNVALTFSAWFRHHYRAFELQPCPTGKMSLITHDELAEKYPLHDYFIGPLRLVTFKRYPYIKSMC